MDVNIKISANAIAEAMAKLTMATDYLDEVIKIMESATGMPFRSMVADARTDTPPTS